MGALLRGQHDAVLPQQFGKVREHFRHGVGQDAAQVVDGVTGLVHRSGADLAQFIRLPHLVDDLGELAVLATTGGRALNGGFGQDVRELADLVQH